MFGGPVDPPVKPKAKQKPDPQYQDILNPSAHPGYHAHYGREPNTNYKTRLLHYKQRSTALERESMDAETQRVVNERFKMKFQWNTDKKRAALEVRNRVKEKLKEFDEELERKRDRLRELLALEEREECRETVDNLQKGDELKFQEMKAKVQRMEAEKEAKRLKLVEEKRIQQYTNRFEDLRPVMSKKQLVESKRVQLQQMRENEARREAERELDRMWEHVMNRDIQAKMDREEQESINEYRKLQETRDFLQKQIQGKQLAKIEQERTMQEDRLEMEKISEQLRREQIEALEINRKNKSKMHQELLEQIKFQETVLANRAREEKKLDDALMYLSQLEYEREIHKVKDFTDIARREMAQYRQHLKELERERKLEDIKLNELLEEHRIAIGKKQDEASCKLLEAKEKLLKDVLAGRAEQLAHMKQEAEQQLRKKEAENELCSMAYETNKRLSEEDARRRAEAAKEYRDDLCKQIDYNNELRLRERADLEKQLELGKKEEDKYRKMVTDLLHGEVELGEKHPFRRVLEQYDCQCPKINPKY